MKPLFALMLFWLSTLMFAQSSMHWDYYSTEDYLEEKNYYSSLINLDFLGIVEGDEIETLQEVIQNPINLGTMASYSNYSLWQNDARIRSIDWLAIHGDQNDHSVFQINGDLRDMWISLDQEVFINQGQWFRIPQEDPWQLDASTFLMLSNTLDELQQDNIKSIQTIEMINQNYRAFSIDLINLEDYFYFQMIPKEWRKRIFIIYDANTMAIHHIYLMVFMEDKNDSSIGYSQSFFAHGRDVEIEEPEDFIDATEGF